MTEAASLAAFFFTEMLRETRPKCCASSVDALVPAGECSCDGGITGRVVARPRPHWTTRRYAT